MSTRWTVMPTAGEVGIGPSPEPGGGLLALVAEELAVGQPGVVVDGVVDVASSPIAASGVLAARFASAERPCASRRRRGSGRAS